ncbi:MAG: alpha/beta hydrolase [Desulfobulbaceae bacterium]|nr:alpha/beta hydrolase [Desulfobulbaceae bacterium]
MMLERIIYFLHGLDSSGKGTKGRFFAKNFPQVVCPDFEGTLPNRLLQLEALCKNQQQLTLIGSSFGGLMATCYATKHPEKITRLVLLAPALNFEAYQPPAEPLQIPTLIIIGKHDTVTPAALVAPLAEATFADLEIRIEHDDHMLHSTFHHLDWQKIFVG